MSKLSLPCRDYEFYLVRLQRLVCAGESDTEEADNAREMVDGLYRALSSEEASLCQELAGDLDMLDGSEITLKTDEDPDDILAQVGEAFGRRDMEETLRLLRYVPEHIMIQDLAYMRACAWYSLGFHQGALCFVDRSMFNDED